MKVGSESDPRGTRLVHENTGYPERPPADLKAG